MRKPEEIAAQWLGMPVDRLDATTQRVARHFGGRQPIARNVAADTGARSTAGQRAADAVTSLGGSWTFVGLFGATMLAWVGVNAALLLARGQTFDPYRTSCSTCSCRCWQRSRPRSS
jgi:uncharacterized membrane protein